MRLFVRTSLSLTSRLTSGHWAWYSGKLPAEPLSMVRNQQPMKMCLAVICRPSNLWRTLHGLDVLTSCENKSCVKRVFFVPSVCLWKDIRKRQWIQCLSALQCFHSLCLSLLSSLMISNAVIINSLIWCQHLLVHSPDASAHTLYTRHHTHTSMCI